MALHGRLRRSVSNGMGKKQIIIETPEQILTSSAAAAVAEHTIEPIVSKKIDRGRAYVKATYNNTIISLTDEQGNVIAWSTAGALGFTGPKKATPFAASKIVATITEKIKKSGPSELAIFVNGFGGGRDSAIRSFINQGFNVVSITDVTPIPHNGVRSPKPRRI